MFFSQKYNFFELWEITDIQVKFNKKDTVYI